MTHSSFNIKILFLVYTKTLLKLSKPSNLFFVKTKRSIIDSRRDGNFASPSCFKKSTIVFNSSTFHIEGSVPFRRSTSSALFVLLFLRSFSRASFFSSSASFSSLNSITFARTSDPRWTFPALKIIPADNFFVLANVLFAVSIRFFRASTVLQFRTFIWWSMIESSTFELYLFPVFNSEGGHG